MVRAVGWVVAGLLGVLSAVAIGCGSESRLLSQTDAAALKDTLQQVRAAVDAGDCSVARARLRELRRQRSNLPGSVDRELRVNLREEIDNKLVPAAEDECDAQKTVKIPTVTEPAPTGPTGPTVREPTPSTQSTKTTPPPTDTTRTTPTPPVDPGTTNPQPPPSDPTRDPGGFGDGSGNGNGNGNGNGK